MITNEVPEAQHAQEHPGHEGHHPHDDAPYTEGRTGSPSGMGMQDVIEESVNKPVQESSQQQTGMKGGELHGQSAGMNPVTKEDQALNVPEKSENEGHSKADKGSNK
ncbi:MAG: hypothetical protein HS132_07610 [Planctomycetia bacterium]|nr:hypothetical protein [Planctomycetia bacterium]